MSEVQALFLNGLIALFPLLFGFLHTSKAWGVGFILFSPPLIFAANYYIAFILRPLLYYGLGWGEVMYDWTTYSRNDFLFSQLLAAVGFISFFVGYLFTYRPRINSKSLNGGFIHRLQLGSALLAFTFSLAFVILLYKAGALTTNPLHNRLVFFNAIVGGGFISLINLVASLCLTINLLIYANRGQLGYIAGAAAFLHLLGNLAISSRNQVTVVLFLFLIAFYCRRWNIRQKINIIALVIAMFVILSAGILIGILRNEEPEASWRLILSFMTATFDMGELFAETVHKVQHLYLGIPWLEDLFFTYLPRSIFEFKPVVYGATRFQMDIAIDTLSTEGAFSATFPIGVFGEAYANFGVIGIPLTLLLLGSALRKMFSTTLSLLLRQSITTSSLVLAALYINLCANGLGYMRSLGSFLSGALFLTALILILIPVASGIGSLVSSIKGFTNAVSRS